MSHFVVSNGHDIWIISEPGESGHININQLQLAMKPTGTLLFVIGGVGRWMNELRSQLQILLGGPTNSNVLIGEWIHAPLHDAVCVLYRNIIGSVPSHTTYKMGTRLICADYNRLYSVT